MPDWDDTLEIDRDVMLKRCRPEDAASVSKLGRDTYSETFASLNSEATMAAYLDEAFAPERILMELQTMGSVFYFLLVGGRMAGYLKLNEPPAQSDVNEPGTLEIERIYVKKQMQGKGLGKAMADAAERIGRCRNAARIWLGVWEKNESAIGFYRRMGFTETGRHAFRMGNELQSDLVMTKILA